MVQVRIAIRDAREVPRDRNGPPEVPVAVRRKETPAAGGRIRQGREPQRERREEHQKHEPPVPREASGARAHPEERNRGRAPPPYNRLMVEGRRARFWAVVLLLASAGSALVVDHARLDSPTMDEPIHTLAAAEYAIAGTYYANLEHPPLVKLLSGFAIRAAGGRAPKMDVPFSMASAEQPRPFSFNSPLRPETLFAVARAPVTALFFLLVVVTGWAVRSWAGDLAGILAAALLAFEPNLLAHAGVVHTDLAAALGFFGTLVLAAHALERRSLGLWAATGAALGASLAAKFSCVLQIRRAEEHTSELQSLRHL